jgi:2,3-bisphosphoglycerate-independent phosphoglycerate mutase
MSHPKTIVFLGDGMADEPVAALGGRTPLQYARTPAMDSIAREGRCGSLLTLPAGFPTSSEVANMSVLGCDLAAEYTGRGPLEALGRDVPLAPTDAAFRLNLVTLSDGVLSDYSAGHVRQEVANELVNALNGRFGGPGIRFYPGVSYRNLLVLSGPDWSADVRTEKPDDHQGDRVVDYLPKPKTDAARRTVDFLLRLMTEAPAFLDAHPVNARLRAAGSPMANGVWPWSGGRAGAFRSLRSKYGITGAVISAVDVINGLGRALGMDVIRVPGATGYIDTNYEGKADAAVKALASHDFVYLHVEGIDEVSHERNLENKIRAIEDFDSRCIARVLARVGSEVNAAVLPDHPVPIALGKHTRTPVPVAVRQRDVAPDNVTAYDELSCPRGSLGALVNGDFMRLLFPTR